MFLNVIHALPCACNICCTIATDNRANGVIQAYFIVQVVEMPSVDKVTILVRIIDFCYENDIRVFCFNLRNNPSPEIARHHFCHVAAETIYSFCCPKKEYVTHLYPCVGCRRAEHQLACALIVHAIVELDSLVPVILANPWSKAVVSRHLGWIFYIVTHFVVVQREVGWECRARHIIEVVIGIESFSRIIVLAEVTHTFRLSIRVILACYVVRHKINNHLEVCFVCTHHKVFKLFHAFRHLCRQVRVDVIIVFDGIWATSIAFHDCGVILGNSILCMVAFGGMLNEPGVPNMGCT